MSQSRITELRPNGGWEAQDGTHYNTFHVTLEDGNYGNANTKGQQPPYGVGDLVEYQITGNYKGVPKLKITKPGQQFSPPARQSAPAPVLAPPARQTAEVHPINGATVGMAMNQAIPLLTRELNREQLIEWLCTPGSWLSVMEVASDIIRVSRHLESGHLAPSVSDRAKGVTQAKRADPPPSPPVSEDDFDEANPPF